MDGGAVRVTSAHGSLVGRAAVSATIDPGAVAITHADPHVEVGHLTSTTVDVDPLSGQITQTGIPVEISAA